MRTYAYALPLTLILFAPACATTLCGDSKDCAPTDTATTDITASTTDAPTGTTTGTASEPTSTASETDATASETSTVSETATTAETTDATTAETTDATTSETTDATTSETTDGPLLGEPGSHTQACAPNDGPAVEFEIALAERACDADWPEDAPQLRIALFKDAGELQLGEHPLFGGLGFAWFDDGDGTPESTDQGKIEITEITADGVRGTFELTLPDNNQLNGAFDSLFCPADIMCG
ncbi:hypothetical protein OV090_14270 [Nannocystis sp. RBIL2]|uniref:hypothetical protein n=1 Tax=Nannocystis sp. RBIL2 TaxID=2996788 RepID=UPI0022708764|nr:hypothetical protein [Nannocystis sp. RBIL2]MCY1065942.1 hypothetical protein [Nannocystis sp. RBIL2]